MKVSVKGEGDLVQVRCHGTGARLLVERMEVCFAPGDVPRARCHLFVDNVSLDAEARFFTTDPETGYAREVKAIEWADGQRTEL